MDITPLFLTAAEEHRQRRASAGMIDAVLKLPPRPPLHVQAEEIARAIKSAGASAVRLHRLARRRALFNDPAADINGLAQVVKSQLEAVNTAHERFQAGCALQRGADPRKGGALSPSPRAHWTLVGEALRQHALDVMRLFQDALATRSRNLQEHSQRRRAFDRSNFVPNVLPDAALFAPLAALAADPHDTAAAAAPFSPSSRHDGLRSRRVLLPASHIGGAGGPGSSSSASPGGGGSGSSACPQPHASLSPAHHHAGGSGGSAGGLRGLALPVVAAASAGGGVGARQQQPHPGFLRTNTASPLSQHQQQPFGGSSGAAAASAYTFTAQQVAQYHTASSRADEQQHVEATVVEIGHMFARMASVVAEQGELIESIDKDMDDTLANVEAGHSELLRFYDSVSQHRGVILKLLAVAAVLVLVVALTRRLQ